jgi:hypothetical protein
MIPLTSAVSAVSLALSMLGGVPVQDELVDPPALGPVLVDVISVNGSGCPAGTSAIALTPDTSDVEISFSDYLVQAGPGVKATESRKNCTIALSVHAPTGFTFAITQAGYRGWGSLQVGATSRFVASYYFRGMSQTNTATHSFTGPLEDEWQTTDNTDIAAITWAPCGEPRYLNINTEARVSAGSGATAVSYFSVEEAFGFTLLWQRCPTTGA